MEDQKLSITQLSELLNVHVNTIRQWEKQFEIVVPRAKDNQRSRYYTEKEISIFTKIKDMRKENISIDNIKRILNRDIEVIEQEEQALEVLPMSELSITEMKDMITNIVLQREEELKEEFEKKLEEKLQKGFEQQEKKIREQIQIENQKLMDYMQKTREEEKEEQKNKKSFWSKIFGK